MSEWELPRNLLDDVEEEVPGSARRLWMAGLSGIVNELAARWSLDVGRPFQPGGTASWVAAARTASGERVVLKVGWRHDEALHEAEGLRAWDGAGAVGLLDATTFGQTSALLLEACEPGTALSEVEAEPEQDVIVADLLRRLWITPPTGHPFRALQSMCDTWADGFDARYATTAHGASGLDRGLAREGAELFRDLPRTARTQTLLCTDLHAGNVLASAREPWLVVDPKPYAGDPAYDALQHMLNCDRLLADPAGLARRMAGLLDLDSQRLRAWLFARCVVESLDQPDLRRVVVALAP